MKIQFRTLGFAAAFLTALYAFSGCNEATVLGKELIPGSDKVVVKDTTINNLITSNIARVDSSIRTGNSYYQGVLGSITQDPIFGKTHGFLYTQVSLPKAEFTFEGTGWVLDSVVLYVGCDTVWYGENAPLNVKVYRMNEPNFKIDTAYMYNVPRSYDLSKEIGNAIINPVYPKDSLSIYGVKYAPQLRIPLKPSFGQELFQQRADGAFKNDSSFRDWLKGLAIVPDTTNGRTMLYTNLNSGSTRITVYYKNSEKDSLMASFAFDPYSSAHANYVARNYTGKEVANLINTANPLGDNVVYIQEAPGIYTNIQIPNIADVPNAVINKAEIVITEINSGSAGLDNIFAEPERLMLRRYITHDSLAFLFDYGNPSSPDLLGFGGNKIVISDLGPFKVVQYKFNIARHLQLAQQKKIENSVLKLEGWSSRMIDLPRLKAGGGSATPPANVKLRIIYTEL
ncbi:DUF4270 domain-containing protein [Chitinophaga deserti]|uniref:DUF4270 domain-containing protein n=1 Tax=Chitinophaga deserti TaxID=2164099 RepID=UPI0013005BC0|nr:DUF4270 domain-containing protein [Chitinophaga deserti]